MFTFAVRYTISRDKSVKGFVSRLKLKSVVSKTIIGVGVESIQNVFYPQLQASMCLEDPKTNKAMTSPETAATILLNVCQFYRYRNSIPSE